ncbi:hypothetical protein [Mycobacteroides abscessus]|uniref:hypothetical protein n=1 Tax=Mycobacteroides abscessus TaxID=36809 RepID=UPI001F18C0D9|nr:hypothetical protein [Mycobacteroides abscessus]
MTGTTVELAVPDGWTIQQQPVITIDDDGGPVITAWGMGIVRSEHTVRVTARGKIRTATADLARTAAGHFSTARIPGLKVSGVGTVLEARDRETGACLASVLITVQARAKEI